MAVHIFGTVALMDTASGVLPIEGMVHTALYISASALRGTLFASYTSLRCTITCIRPERLYGR